ncbi:MAG: hypothetical protein ACK53W_12625 [Gemmatimonadota bacterium]
MTDVGPQRVAFDFDRLRDLAMGKVAEAIHEALQDTIETVVTRTPVDTGFLRSSWYAGINRDPDGHQGQAGQPFTVVVSRLTAVAAAMPLAGTFYLLNNCSYAVHQEYGTSRMEGRAFVRSTVAMFPTIADQAARRVAAGEYGGERLGGGGAIGNRGGANETGVGVGGYVAP